MNYITIHKWDLLRYTVKNVVQDILAILSITTAMTHTRTSCVLSNHKRRVEYSFLCINENLPLYLEKSGGSPVLHSNLINSEK